MTIQFESFLIPPTEGDSYWFGVDLFTFKAVGASTNKTYAMCEAVIQPQSGTPPHVHSHEDESFYVQSGEFEFQLNEKIVRAKTGTFLYSPKGQRHSFKNTSDKPAKLLIWLTPAGFEKFMAEVGVRTDLQVEPPQPFNSGDLDNIVAAARDYGIEILPA